MLGFLSLTMMLIAGAQGILKVKMIKATEVALIIFAEQTKYRVAKFSGCCREIAGAQEGTRTPTELPAST